MHLYNLLKISLLVQMTTIKVQLFIIIPEENIIIKSNHKYNNPVFRNCSVTDWFSFDLTVFALIFFVLKCLYVEKRVHIKRTRPVIFAKIVGRSIFYLWLQVRFFTNSNSRLFY